MVASNDKKVDKNLRKEQTEIFKQEKPKDEKRILDFFQNFLIQKIKNYKVKQSKRNL